MALLGELQRRNVLRMAGLYLVGAWLVVQVAATLLPVFDAPAWVMRTVVVLLAIGFVPALVFAWVFELTPDGLRREARVPAGASIAPQTARRMDRALIVVLALAVAYFAIDKFALAPARESAVATARTDGAAPAAAVAAEPSIAVLPFANLSNDPEQAYFSDGLAEDLIAALSRSSGLKVISRNSSFRFRDAAGDTRAIGAELGVAHLLTGSVRRAGDQVRISTDLVAVADGRTLWSQRFDRPYADLFALQDEITAAVASTLQARLLSTGSASQSDRPPGGDLAAYNAYLQGRFHAARPTPESFAEAEAYFEEAIRIDPAYAQAHAALGSVRVLTASLFLGGDEAADYLRRARGAIDTALRLAPDLAFAHVVHARLLTNGELRWADSTAGYRRALELAPQHVEALSGLAQNLAILGRVDEAEATFLKALELDPLDSTSAYWLSVMLYGIGRLDDAEHWSAHALELQPDALAGRAHSAALTALRGDAAGAIAKARAMPPSQWRDIALAIATQRAGDATAADAALAHLIAGHSDSAAFQVAQVYAWRGDADRTFEWLERAWTNRDPGLRRTLTDPFLAPYRDDPRFAALCRKIGLPPPDAPRRA